MGLWYSLATLVFVGGSWINHGGQNMLEPVRLGAACMIGPSNHNFKEVMQRLRAVNGIAEVRNEAEALEWLRRLMTDDLMRLQQKQRGLEAFNDDIDHIVDNYLAIVRHCMDSMESGTKSQ
jgi:3-deoxy-D-manno-octulosonic-acid transferase